MYVTGGDCYQGGCSEQIVGETEVFDPATKTWSFAARMRTPRFGHAVAAGDGVLYAVGGDGADSLAVDGVLLEALTP